MIIPTEILKLFPVLVFHTGSACLHIPVKTHPSFHKGSAFVVILLSYFQCKICFIGHFVVYNWLNNYAFYIRDYLPRKGFSVWMCCLSHMLIAIIRKISITYVTIKMKPFHTTLPQ